MWTVSEFLISGEGRTRKGHPTGLPSSSNFSAERQSLVWRLLSRGNTCYPAGVRTLMTVLGATPGC